MLWYKKRYKVVFKGADGKYFSAVARDAARVEYKVGGWVTSPEWLHDAGYYPMVFKKKKDAIRFLQGNICRSISHYIFECRVKGRYYIPKKLLDLDGLMDGIIRPYPIYDPKPPKGTEAWEYVKLTKEVKSG